MSQTENQRIVESQDTGENGFIVPTVSIHSAKGYQSTAVTYPKFGETWGVSDSLRVSVLGNTGFKVCRPGRNLEELKPKKKFIKRRDTRVFKGGW